MIMFNRARRLLHLIRLTHAPKPVQLSSAPRATTTTRSGSSSPDPSAQQPLSPVAQALADAVWARVRSSQFEEALVVFGQHAAVGIVPSTSAWNALLYGSVVRLRNHAFARAVLERMRAGRVSKDTTTVALRLLYCFLDPSARGWAAAAEEVASARRLGIRIAPATHSQLIRGMARARRFEEARSLLASLPAASVEAVAYRSLMTEALRADAPKVAVDVFSDVLLRGSDVPLDVQTCNVALSALALLSSRTDPFPVRRAAQVFDAMARRGVTPDTATFDCFADLLLRAGRVADAVALPRQALEAGASPSASMYSRLMRACVTEGRADTAFRLYTEMLGGGGSSDSGGGIAPKSSTISVMIAACTDDDRVPLTAVADLLDHAHTLGLPIRGSIFAAVLSVVLRRVSVDAGMRLWHAAAALSIAPDETTVEALVRGAAERGGALLAVNVLLEHATVFREAPASFKRSLLSCLLPAATEFAVASDRSRSSTVKSFRDNSFSATTVTTSGSGSSLAGPSDSSNSASFCIPPLPLSLIDRKSKDSVLSASPSAVDLSVISLLRKILEEPRPPPSAAMPSGAQVLSAADAETVLRVGCSAARAASIHVLPIAIESAVVARRIDLRGWRHAFADSVATQHALRLVSHAWHADRDKKHARRPMSHDGYR